MSFRNHDNTNIYAYTNILESNPNNLGNKFDINKITPLRILQWLLSVLRSPTIQIVLILCFVVE